MGGSQSTTSSRAAKFSGNGGNRRSVRAVRSAPATEMNSRRATSCRNTNRNVKEFSKFWSDAGSVNRSKSSTRASTKHRNGTANGNNGSIRRNRTQSVDVRRTSNVLPVPGTPSASTSPRVQNQRRATSFRSNGGSTTSSTLTVNGEGRKSRKGSTTDLLTPNSARSEVYCVEFNQAAIAAARLKRLSLTPYPADTLSPRHHRSNSQKKNSSTPSSSTSTLTTTSSKNLTPNHQQPQRPHSSQQHHHHRDPYQNSPETAIY